MTDHVSHADLRIKAGDRPEVTICTDRLTIAVSSEDIKRLVWAFIDLDRHDYDLHITSAIMAQHFDGDTLEAMPQDDYELALMTTMVGSVAMELDSPSEGYGDQTVKVDVVGPTASIADFQDLLEPFSGIQSAGIIAHAFTQVGGDDD